MLQTNMEPKNGPFKGGPFDVRGNGQICSGFWREALVFFAETRMWFYVATFCDTELFSSHGHGTQPPDRATIFQGC